MRWIFSRVAALLALVGALSAFAPAVPALAQASSTGTVVVTVRDAAGLPVPQAQVSVVNTLLGGQTGEDGTLTIRGVTAGQQMVRALRIGYAEQKGAVQVSAGQVATIELRLSTVAVSLSAVVSTATGPARRVELGNAIPTIDAVQETKLKPISNLQDLLNGRAPGVQLSSGTQAGTGARVRIRGSGSLNLSNDPIYVIDGVRMTSNNGSFAFFTGDAQTSRVVDINPEELGYHGHIHMLVGMNMTGTLTGVIVDWNTEPYGDFSVEPPAFGAQFKGKSIRDPFVAGKDVDIVSRATITVRAAARTIRESSRTVARALLTPDAVK